MVDNASVSSRRLASGVSVHVLILGKNGQVARALADVLPTRGLQSTAIGRPEYDLADPDRLVSAVEDIRPSIIINPAAYTNVDRAEDEPDLAFAINSRAAGAIAAATHALQIPIIHLSTDYIFDGNKSTPYLESDPTAPLGIYGASKLAGEAAVAEANAKHVILRTSWVCSPYGTNFLKTMLRLAAERPELRVVDDQVGAPTFAHDIASAIADIVLKLTATPEAQNLYGTFHYASCGETTWCRFARDIFERSARRGGARTNVTAIATHEYPTKVRRPKYSKLDTTKIFDAYAIAAPNWEAGLETCLDQLLVQQPAAHGMTR